MVVVINKVTERTPIVLNWAISFKSEIPFIIEAKIKGMAISFKRLINIMPNGLIQF